MKRVLNPKWVENIISDSYSNKIDETLTHSITKRFLIQQLTKANRIFKVYPLGCGVVRITTETDTCPCCKRPL